MNMRVVTSKLAGAAEHERNQEAINTPRNSLF